MKRNLLAALTTLALTATACGPEVEFEAEDKLTALQATRAGKAVVDAATTIGLLPKWSCGQPEKEAFLSLRPRVQQKLGGCAQLNDRAGDAVSDGLELTFPEAGCQVGKATWTGGLQLAYSGGDDRHEVFADLHRLSIDSHPVDGRVGYLGCGDLNVYEVQLHSRIPFDRGTAPLDIAFNGTVTDRPGLPVIGTDFYVVNGPATVVADGQTVQVDFREVYWEPGANAPAKGELVLTKPDGRTLSVTFDPEHHLAEVQSNHEQPIPVPLP